jgi:nicotinamide riboside transporter PnuC
MNSKTIGWIAAIFSIVGVLLNAYKIIWCWPLWCIGNLLWIYLAVKNKDIPQFVLWVVFTLTNCYAWYQWSIN